MRFQINLATHPYEDARSFYKRWGIALGVVMLLTLVLVGISVHEWMSTRSVAQQIHKTREGIAKLEEEKTRQLAILNRPENAGTRDRAEFVNELIARKTFSWTQVFADLEKLMPTQVHVVSIQPEVKPENQILMKMQIAGNSRGKAIELVSNLEKSRHFRQVQLVTDTTSQQPQPGGDSVQFSIEALYIPGLREDEDKTAVPEKAEGGQ